MEKYFINKETLTGIADAVRQHSDSSELIAVKDLAQKVNDLPVIKNGVIWDNFDEEGWVTEATLVGTGNAIPNELFKSTSDTSGHHGIYCRLQKINLPTTITKIGEYAFSDCYLLSSFDFSNIEEISRSAFSGCENLVLTQFPPKLKAMQQGIFSNCPKVSFTELPNGVEYSTSACSSMTGLTHIKMPDEWTHIPGYCFSSCSNLVSVEFPPNVTHLGTWCFSLCQKLALKELPETLIEIPERAFWQTPALEISEIPASVQTIGKWAFQGCAKMKTLTFKGTPTSLDAAVFYNCNNLTTINVPWAEGEVANAPWGATKATINYNYVAPAEEE